MKHLISPNYSSPLLYHISIIAKTMEHITSADKNDISELFTSIVNAPLCYI